MKLRPLVLALPALGVIALVAATSGGAGATSSTDIGRQNQALVAKGRALFLTSCVSCHGADGRGTKQGPGLVGVGAASADFMLSTGRMPLTNPSDQAIRKPPAFDRREIDALVAYVASLGPGPPIPHVDVKAGDLAQGGSLFRLNCAACHNSAGTGGALSYGSDAPNLRHANTVQIAEAIRTGPGQMPVFGPDTFTKQQVNNVVRYVRYLQNPEDRGGFSLGHLGPVPEGLVALVAGLGFLILVSRWIEARA